MAVISVPGQSGRSYSVRIAGNTPTPQEQANIDSYVARMESTMAASNAAPDDRGGLGTAFGVGVDVLQQGYGSALEGIGSILGSSGIEKYGKDIVDANNRQIAEATQYLTGREDVTGVGSALSFFGETLAQQAPQIGVSLGGAAAGGAAAGSIFGPPGMAIGAAIGGTLANLPFFYGQNRERQKEAIDKGLRVEMDEGAAALASVPQAALDAIVDRFMIGKVLNPDWLKAGGIFTRGVKGAGAGVVVEVPTEIGQAVIERFQAGLPIDDAEAIKEYEDVAIAAGLVGGTVSGVAGISAGDIRKKKQEEKDKEALAQIAEDQADEEEEVSNKIKFGLAAADKEAQEQAASPATDGLLALPKPSRLTPDQETTATVSSAQGKDALEGVKQGETVPTSKRTFDWQQYDIAAEKIASLGKYSAPAIQRAVKSQTKSKVPMSVVRDITDEMVRRGVLRADTKSDTGYVVEPKTEVPFTEASSLQKTIDQLERAIEADRKAREKALLDVRKLEQTGGTRQQIRQTALLAEKIQNRIDQSEKVRADVIGRISSVKQSGVVPTTERPRSLVDGAGKAPVPITEAPADAQAAAVEKRTQNLQTSLAYYEQKVKQGREILKRLRAEAKKVQLPKSDLDKMKAIQDQIDVNQYAADAIRSRIKNPSADIQIAQAQAAANEARAAAAKAEVAKRTPAYSAKEFGVFNALRKRLSNLGLSDVNLTAEKIIRPEGVSDKTLVEGVFDVKDGNRVIALSMGVYDPSLTSQQLFDRLAAVMNHEVIHALKNLGLFTDAEWRSLSELARRQKYMKVKSGKAVERAYTYFQRAQQMYKGASEEIHIEEAVAEMFRDYVDGKLKVGGKPRSLMERIKNFFKSIWGAHVDADIDPNTIFEGVRFGQIGARDRKPVAADQETRASKAMVERAKEIEKFDAWFGDSKAVDENGNPQVYYTGTSKDKDFTSFNVGRHGAWFTTDPTEASNYAFQNDSMGYRFEGRDVIKTNTASRVIPAFLRITNPYRGPLPRSAMSANYKKAQSDWFDTLRAQGYDGWMPESDGSGFAPNVVVVLNEPNQIKSAFAKEFNLDKKDMRMSILGGRDIAEGDQGGKEVPDREGVRRAPVRRVSIGGRDAAAVAVFGEGSGRPVYEIDDPTLFREMITAAKEALGPIGAQVHVYDDYAGKRLFLFDDGASGFALDDDNIVSVFSVPGRAPSGAGRVAIDLAISEGGRRLDAFDTFLPRLYAKSGFKAVAKLQFDPQYAPDGWDYGFFSQSFPKTAGMPDVVYMVFDPVNAASETPNVVTDPDDGEAAQAKYLSLIKSMMPRSGVNTRMSMLMSGGKYDQEKIDDIEGASRSRASTRIQDDGDSPDRISTRLPTTKRATEDPLAENLIVNTDAMRASPEAFAHNMALLKAYPGFSSNETDPDRIAEDFKKFVSENLKWLYNHVDGRVRNRSKKWYEGARRIAEIWSGQFGIPDFSAAGVLAALSPQKDWYMNVSLAERVIDIHTTFSGGNLIAFMPTPEMSKTAVRIYAGDRYQDALGRVLSSPYSSLSSEADQAMWLRLYDETYNPRGYRDVSAEGDFVGKANGKVAWGSNAEIAKAIYVLKNQTRAATSEAMGRQNKVRNFFNNILAPNAPHGDVTIDTHAVAAALVRPLSGSSAEVLHAFGSSPIVSKQPEGWIAAKSVADTGARGTYGIYADAYRMAADELGVLPRELQSIAWEAVRGLFPAAQKKSAAKKSAVNNEWLKAERGEITPSEARENIIIIMGGIDEPTWYGLYDPADDSRAPSSYEGELAVSRINRELGRAAGTDVGTSPRDAGRTGEPEARRGTAAGAVLPGTAGIAEFGAASGGRRYSAVGGASADGGRDRGRRPQGGGLAPLEGAPRVAGATGPDQNLIKVAEDYARNIGVDLKRQSEFVEVDPERATRIAAAYDAMEHSPRDPKVKAAYDDLIKQTVAQYMALKDAGYEFYFFDPNGPDPYGDVSGGFGNPWNAMRDLRANKRMAVFPTEEGFGSGATELNVDDNPLLLDTGIKWGVGSPEGRKARVLANDLFRAVHDAFGHGIEGAGFRARGEENAWQAHIRLFTGLAKGALTSETRGQNSWLNYGPYGESNRTAKVEDTVFADQKTGLMPEWTWQEGIAGDAEYPSATRASIRYAASPQPSVQPQQVAQAQNGMMYARTADMFTKVLNLGGAGVERKKAERIADGILRRFQDNMLPVGRMVQELSRDGLTITDAMDPYLREELMHGVVGDRIERNQKNLMMPVLDAVKRINVSDADVQALRKASDAASGKGRGYATYALEDASSPRLALADVYLYARHAKERNRWIKANRDESNDSGSGMTDAEADAILNWFNSLSAENKTAIRDMATGVRSIVADTNQTRLDGGLINQDMIDEGTQWQFYVPLRGIEDADGDRQQQDEIHGPPARPRFGARGREDMRALGRGGYASDILANVMTQNQNAILRAERNKVGQSFLKLLRSDPQKTSAYASILERRPMMRATSASGKVRMVVDPTAHKRPDMLVVKEDGREVFVQFDDLRLAGALNGQNGMSPTTGSSIVNALGKINRYLSSINTSYNPEFVITNMVRDLQTAGVNLNQYDADGLTSQAIKSVLPALQGIKRSILNGDNSSEWSQIYRDFVEAGGQNSTNQMNSVADQMNNINGMLGDISTAGVSGKWAKVKNGFVGKGVGSVLKFLEDYNTVVENGIRVATYKALLDRGFSKDRAAQAARNVTVNFAKSGEYRNLMNSMYLFYNASIQGTFAMLNAAVKSPRVRKIWAGIVVAGILQDQLNALLSPEDEDEQKVYDKIPDYILEHNLILPDPFGITERSYISIPLPYGLNMALNAGRAMSRAQRGAYDGAEAAKSIIGTAVDVVNPLGGTESFASFAAPTVLDPFIDVMRNVDFSGKPIYKEALPFDRTPDPASQMYWSTTSPSAIWIAQNLNELTGGNAVRSGFIDWSPDVMEFWFDFLTGGVGRFVQRTAELPGNVVDAGLSDELVRSVPFVRKLVGSVSEREDTGSYIEKASRVLTAGEELKQAREAGDVKWARETIQQYGKELRLLGQVKAADSALRKISKQMKAIEENPRIPDDRKRELKRVLSERKQMILSRANRLLADV